uniref:DUF4283 domain-containing protein n=1 Tax=Gossypium raimondii TaxID=29730 RepID=A0A0D2RXH8_GOSRA|nr:hypothetical protein B456_004G116200 [Gossypium raimondii]
MSISDELVVSPDDAYEEDINYKLCLVGKFLGARNINFNAMERMLLNLWKPFQGENIRMLGDNLNLVQFYHMADMKMMISGGPWSFNHCVLLIHLLAKGENPEDVHKLSPGFTSKSLAKNLGNVLGSLFLDYDPGVKRAGRNNYMLIWVRLDNRLS